MNIELDFRGELVVLGILIVLFFFAYIGITAVENGGKDPTEMISQGIINGMLWAGIAVFVSYMIMTSQRGRTLEQQITYDRRYAELEAENDFNIRRKNERER